MRHFGSDNLMHWTRRVADSSLVPAVTAVATLLGGMLGASGAYLIQRGQWREQRQTRWDETRRATYAGFLAACNERHLAIWHAMRDGLTPDVAEKLSTANDQVVAFSGETSLLGSPATRAAAAELANFLTDLGNQLTKDAVPGANYQEALAEYLPRRDAFRGAARAELGL